VILKILSTIICKNEEIVPCLFLNTVAKNAEKSLNVLSQKLIPKSIVKNAAAEMLRKNFLHSPHPFQIPMPVLPWAAVRLLPEVARTGADAAAEVTDEKR
jgi:hypothetical protein